MISITPKNEYKNGFTIEGHAEHAPHGYDIICASVSVLAQALTYDIERAGYARTEARSGYFDCNIPLPTIASDTLMYTLGGALTRLERQYPEHIKVLGENHINGEN
jgi:uncharacterized protein YsxB (DUF464 family)